MSLSDDIKVLKNVELFAGFNDEQLRLLAFGCQHKALAEGEELFHNGAWSQGGYVVVSGSLKYTPPVIASNNPKPWFIGPGSLVGMMGLISRVRHTGEAIAQAKMDIMLISRDIFLRMLEEYPDLANQLHQRIAKSVQDDIRNLERIQRKLG